MARRETQEDFENVTVGVIMTTATGANFFRAVNGMTIPQALAISLHEIERMHDVEIVSVRCDLTEQ